MCVLQYYLGAEPAKYSVRTVDPPCAFSHTPGFASFPDLVHILAETMDSGFEKSFT